MKTKTMKSVDGGRSQKSSPTDGVLAAVHVPGASAPSDGC